MISCREFLRAFCPKLSQKSGYHYILDKDLVSKKIKFEKKFQNLIAFVEKNKKLPEYKEDFTEIRNDKFLYFIYQKIKCLSCLCYTRNKKYIAHRRKVLGTEEAEKLFQFLDKALEYQKNNLFWFSSVNWFNRNSAKIFEHFAKIEQKKEKKEPEILGKKLENSAEIVGFFVKKEEEKPKKT